MTGGRICNSSDNRGRIFTATTVLGHHSINQDKHQHPKEEGAAVFLLFVMFLLGSRTITTGEEDAGLGAIRQDRPPKKTFKTRGSKSKPLPLKSQHPVGVSKYLYNLLPK